MKNRRGLWIGIGVVAVAGLLYAAGLGRTRVTGGSKGPASSTMRLTDPWPVASGEIVRQPDAVTARRVLHQLNADLLKLDQSLPRLTTDEAQKLNRVLHPSPDEAKDLAAASFTPMDANYLAECLYFQAVARSLDLDGLPVAAQAKSAFDWVCRQMVLSPWRVTGPNGSTLLPPVPPQVALARGHGTGVERVAAFLALARQLGLDAGLIGPPGAETKRATEAKPDGSLLRGPFWAVGVRDGKDVVLFDPWAGLAVPGTLNMVKAKPAETVSWIERHAPAFTLKPDEIVASIFYHAAPLNAFTPRIKVLEQKLVPETGVKLAMTLDDSASWHSPPTTVDPFSITHGLGTYTPKDDGGYDPTPTGPQQLASLVGYLAAVNAVSPAVPEEITVKPARQVFLDRSAMFFKQLLIDSGLRDRIQRGQLNEAVKQLVDLDSTFRLSRERLRNDPDLAASMKQWHLAAADAYEKYRLSSLPENAGNRPQAEAAVADLWVKGRPIFALIEACVGEAGAAEAAYLLALAKHEQAERSQIRWVKNPNDATAGKATADWAVAADAWARYQQSAKKFESAHPGRAEQAAKLAARAANPREEPR